jgi:hypothetical protein
MEEILLRIEKKLDLLLETKNTVSELVTIEEAMAMLGRGRSWFNQRTISETKVNIPFPKEYYFIRGVDAVYLGRQLHYKRRSIERMRETLLSLGKKYIDSQK